MDKLVSYLPAESFEPLDNFFDNNRAVERKLLHQKRFCSHNYFNNFAKFETGFLLISFSTNSLKGNENSITETENAHAEKVFVTLRCRTLGDYHDLYLNCDTLLLACIVEKFRKVCYDTCGLYSVLYLTSSHVSGDAIVKSCEANLELLTDRENLEMAGNMIREGVASIFSKRFFKANNKYMKLFNANEETSFGLLMNAKPIWRSYGEITFTSEIFSSS